MTLGRSKSGINKAVDAGRKDAQIGFADALGRIFPTALARYLLFRGGIRQETLCDRSSVTFDMRQCVNHLHWRPAGIGVEQIHLILPALLVPALGYVYAATTLKSAS